MTSEQLKFARSIAKHVRDNPPEGIQLVRDVPDPHPCQRWRFVLAHDSGGSDGEWMSAEGDVQCVPADDPNVGHFDALLCIGHDGIPDLTDPVTEAWCQAKWPF